MTTLLQYSIDFIKDIIVIFSECHQRIIKPIYSKVDEEEESILCTMVKSKKFKKCNFEI